MTQNQSQQPKAESKEADNKTASGQGDTVKLINKSSGIRRVLNRPIMPDDDGIEITKAELEALKKGKAFQARLAAKEFEVK